MSSAAIVILTTQRDEVLPSDADQTVQATVATLSCETDLLEAVEPVEAGEIENTSARQGEHVVAGATNNRLTLRDGADLTVTTDFQDVSAYSSLQIDLANSTDLLEAVEPVEAGEIENTSARQGEHVVAGATIKTVARRKPILGRTGSRKGTRPRGKSIHVQRRNRDPDHAT
jgi:hypothetical protein